jgi:hypothetical protein
VSIAVGAIATLLAAGILRWRHRAGEAATAAGSGKVLAPDAEPAGEVTTEVA